MKKILMLLLVLSTAAAHAQTATPVPHGWHLLDPATNRYMGISLQQAYDRLKGRPSQTIIVAVIDSGIDTVQEDLKGVLWTNPREIPANGIDDDGNGYIDDVHGWNFDGAPNGQNLVRNAHEVERVYHGWKSEFEGRKEKDIPADKKFLYSQWKRAATIIDRDYQEASGQQKNIANLLTALDASSRTLCTALSTTTFTTATIKPLLHSDRMNIARAAELWSDFFTRAQNPDITNVELLKEVSDYKASIDTKIMLKVQPPEDFRSALIHDRYTDITDSIYGNNNLKEGSGNHGTLVAGVIGAVRGNGIGIDGIADNVRIMAMRAVPGGDEHDKDVALSIRYAVNNGARVINMSFGKYVSPYKQFVDDAVRYAESKGVLIIHGSGNDGWDLSKEAFYPGPYFMDGRRATNFLNVGASGDPKDGGYAASFSNYSHELVDVFAPGVDIYTTAANNQYESADGTSLACPVATGVAALLRSYFPKLTPAQVIRILKDSGTPVTADVKVPGSEDRTAPFAALSSSGRIINAAAAVEMALAEEKK